MSRTSIYIPDTLHFKMMKEQEKLGCSFSFLCALAFADFIEKQSKLNKEVASEEASS